MNFYEKCRENLNRHMSPETEQSAKELRERGRGMVRVLEKIQKDFPENKVYTSLDVVGALAIMWAFPPVQDCLKTGADRMIEIKNGRMVCGLDLIEAIGRKRDDGENVHFAVADAMTMVH